MEEFFNQFGIQLMIIYFAFAFIFLVIFDQTFNFKEDKKFGSYRKSKIDSLTILFSIFWLPVIVLIGIWIVFDKMKKFFN